MEDEVYHDVVALLNDKIALSTKELDYVQKALKGIHSNGSIYDAFWQYVNSSNRKSA